MPFRPSPWRVKKPNACLARSELPSHTRAKALSGIAQQLTARQHEFAKVMSLESGKPITDAGREVLRAIQTFTVASEEAKRLPGAQ